MYFATKKQQDVLGNRLLFSALSVMLTHATSPSVRGFYKVRADMESAPTVLDTFCCQDRALCGQLGMQFV